MMGFRYVVSGTYNGLRRWVSMNCNGALPVDAMRIASRLLTGQLSPVACLHFTPMHACLAQEMHKQYLCGMIAVQAAAKSRHKEAFKTAVKVHFHRYQKILSDDNSTRGNHFAEDSLDRKITEGWREGHFAEEHQIEC